MHYGWHDWNYRTAACTGGVNTVSSEFTDGTAKWQAIGLLYVSVEETIKALDISNITYMFSGNINFTITHEAVDGTENLYLNATIPLPSGYIRGKCKYVLLGNVGYSFAYDGQSYNETCDIPENVNRSIQNNGVVKILVWSEQGRSATVNYKVTANNAYYFVFAKK